MGEFFTVIDCLPKEDDDARPPSEFATDLLYYIGSVCKQIPGQGPAAAARDPAPFLLAKSWLTEDFVIEAPYP